jgi:hypothetical protein
MTSRRSESSITSESRLPRLWARVTSAPEGEGMELANAELHAMRREKRAASGP